MTDVITVLTYVSLLVMLSIFMCFLVIYVCRLWGERESVKANHFERESPSCSPKEKENMHSPFCGSLLKCLLLLRTHRSSVYVAGTQSLKLSSCVPRSTSEGSWELNPGTLLRDVIILAGILLGQMLSFCC